MCRSARGRRCSAIDRRTTSHVGHAKSQRLEAFGWIKTEAGQEKTRLRGTGRVGFHLRDGGLQSGAPARGCVGSCAMRSAADHPLIGAWRTVEADPWEGDYLGLVEPAAITFVTDGRGSFVRVSRRHGARMLPEHYFPRLGRLRRDGRARRLRLRSTVPPFRRRCRSQPTGDPSASRLSFCPHWPRRHTRLSLLRVAGKRARADRGARSDGASALDGMMCRGRGLSFPVGHLRPGRCTCARSHSNGD